jgi:thiol-disulfide isomerase/thioredoxin
MLFNYNLLFKTSYFTIFYITIILFIILYAYFSIFESFDNNTKIKVYNFNTTWCGWSKKFQPEWDKFAGMVKDNANISAFDVKMDKVDTSQYDSYNISGFPTVIIENNDKRETYAGDRTASALLDYITTTYV